MATTLSGNMRCPEPMLNQGMRHVRVRAERFCCHNMPGSEGNVLREGDAIKIGGGWFISLM